ncbi:MAG: RNA-guided endonuclease TnpB family protein [Thermoplasmata archaeon]|nr:RNA-guided endonuclease TnpB family protein [Thermoplasmata archaeon]
MPSVRRGLVCRLAGPLQAPLLLLLKDYRLLVNRAVREALDQGLTSRGSLTKFSQGLAREYRILGTHARTAAGTALSLVKGHRRRLRKGRASSVPYCRREFLIADDSSFHLNAETGHLRLSLRNGEWTGFDLVLSAHHRATLASSTIKQLRLRPDRAVLIIEKTVPEPFVPTSLLALDTNERSLDGVLTTRSGSTPVVAPYPDVGEVQHRHFVRRRRLGRKKAHDRRVSRRLGGREGRRERARVTQRLHLLSKGLVRAAEVHGAALALEDLHLSTGSRRLRGSRRMRRRLSSWPQRELHRQLEYKAAERGAPVLKINPAYTSKTCPVCGVIKDRRRRVGRVFVCDSCRWRCDRQRNAGLNICRTALAELPEGAMKLGLGGLRLDPNALAHDAMILLYSPGSAGAHEGSGRRGRNASASPPE